MPHTASAAWLPLQALNALQGMDLENSVCIHAQVAVSCAPLPPAGCLPGEQHCSANTVYTPAELAMH